MLMKGGARVIDYYINQYGKRLYGLCIALCANTAEADDLYQDTWLKVVEHFSKYDPNREFEPWLTRICVNLYRNALRRLSRSPIWNGFSSAEEKDFIIKAVPSETPANYSVLYEAINRLPPKYRITIILFYFRDMDIPSAARALHIPAGTVKSRMSKAKKLLKEAIKDEADILF